jgi:hypothetical protein
VREGWVKRIARDPRVFALALRGSVYYRYKEDKICGGARILEFSAYVWLAIHSDPAVIRAFARSLIAIPGRQDLQS